MSAATTKRRRYERLDMHLPIRISTIDPETDRHSGRPFFRTSQEVSGNLSEGGVFIHTTEPIAPGRRLWIELQLPEAGSVQAVGRVAWSKMVVNPSGDRRESGVGVQFIGAERALYDALERVLAARRESRTGEPDGA